MAFTTLQSVVDALPGQERKFIKSNSSNPSSGNFCSLWGVASEPATGSNPSSGMAGDIPTKATTGAVKFANPASGYTYLGRVEAFLTVAGSGSVLYVYDRLWQQSGIVVTTTGAQTINSVALDRPDANGDDAELWFHIYSATGAGAATPTVSYTNPAGTAGQTATCIGYAASAVQHRCFPFQLASGDTGVKSIQSITLGTSLTSGTVGLILRRKVAEIPIPATGLSARLDAIALGLPRVYDNACLEFVLRVGSSATPNVAGSLNLING